MPQWNQSGKVKENIHWDSSAWVWKVYRDESVFLETTHLFLSPRMVPTMTLERPTPIIWSEPQMPRAVPNWAGATTRGMEGHVLAWNGSGQRLGLHWNCETNVLYYCSTYYTSFRNYEIWAIIIYNSFTLRFINYKSCLNCNSKHLEVQTVILLTSDTFIYETLSNLRQQMSKWFRARECWLEGVH